MSPRPSALSPEPQPSPPASGRGVFRRRGPYGSHPGWHLQGHLAHKKTPTHQRQAAGSSGALGRLGADSGFRSWGSDMSTLNLQSEEEVLPLSLPHPPTHPQGGVRGFRCLKHFEGYVTKCAPYKALKLLA